MFGRHKVPRSRLEVLRRVPFFEGLPQKALARIDSHIDEVAVEAGRVLTKQGGGAFETFIVAEGTAEVRIDDQVIRTTEVGELIGEIGVLQRKVRSATVVAKTPMRLLVIDPRNMSWLSEDRVLAARVQQNLERHTRGTTP